MTDAEKLRNLEDAVRQWLSAEAWMSSIELGSEFDCREMQAEDDRLMQAESLMHATMADG